MNDNSLDIITIFNPDVQSFSIRYNNRSYGVIEPGTAKRMPRFLAKLAVKHLIDQILNRLQKPTNQVNLRDEWATKVVIGEERYNMPLQDTPEEKLAKDIQEMNRNSDLDRIMGKFKANTGETQSNPQVTTANPAPTPPQLTVTDPAIPHIDETGAKVLPEIDETKEDVPVTTNGAVPPGVDPQLLKAANAEAKANGFNENPTREDLYKYASDVLAMKMDDQKTKAVLDAMDIPKLKETLGYDSQAT